MQKTTSVALALYLCYLKVEKTHENMKTTKKITTTYLALSILLLSQCISVGQGLESFTEATDGFLQDNVKNGMVDYKGVKQDFSEVDKLYRQIGDISLKDASEEKRKAFYINAYNVIVIHQVAKAYPVKSPMDIDGFFDNKKHKVAGDMLTLNQLEKEKLMQPYNDPRVHFVLVCAAMSCPPLYNKAYEDQTLDRQLAARTELALNSNDFIKVNESKEKVEVSKIFEWYQGDFTQNVNTVLAYINQYRDKKIPSDYKVGYYEYDWSLNNL